jgi:hypothetical protein
MKKIDVYNIIIGTNGIAGRGAWLFHIGYELIRRQQQLGRVQPGSQPGCG